MLRTVKQGKSDFVPNSSIIPFCPREVNFTFYLTESCWYNTLGEDNYDFNKIGGVWESLRFKKNYNALMNAWRPKLDQYGYFEIVPYENKLGLNLPNEDKKIIRKFDELIIGKIVTKSDGAEIYLLIDNSYILWYKSSLKGFLWSYIDSWFGGTSKAPHDMTNYLSIK